MERIRLFRNLFKPIIRDANQTKPVWLYLKEKLLISFLLFFNVQLIIMNNKNEYNESFGSEWNNISFPGRVVYNENKIFSFTTFFRGVIAM
jgi:hypothetical protein